MMMVALFVKTLLSFRNKAIMCLFSCLNHIFEHSMALNMTEYEHEWLCARRLRSDQAKRSSAAAPVHPHPPFLSKMAEEAAPGHIQLKAGTRVNAGGGVTNRRTCEPAEVINLAMHARTVRNVLDSHVDEQVRRRRSLCIAGLTSSHDFAKRCMQTNTLWLVFVLGSGIWGF